MAPPAQGLFACSAIARVRARFDGVPIHLQRVALEPTTVADDEHLDLPARVDKALDDPVLKLGMSRAGGTFRRLRRDAFRGVDFRAVQESVRRIKADAIENLPALIRQFKDEAEKVGAVVFEARTAEDANRYIVDLAVRNQVRLAVKSKSMATEEIHLNPHLEAAGVKVVETDLGEWIVQLAGERPSHMIAPAIHKPREAVAELFSRVTGETLPPVISELVKVARRELRQAFIDADMGISGANVAVAETGSVVIVTNEGNARMVGTLPPIHVIVVGYEKLVATMEEAWPLIDVLCPSVAGQKIASYVSIITGPSRTADIELDIVLGVHGPKEVHIVLLDNGRMRMRDESGFREALYCLKCSACLNVCPVYRQVGGHAYGTVYVGGIGTVLSTFLEGRKDEGQPLLCTSCHACEEVCPSRIETPRMITDLREDLAQRDLLVPAFRTLKERVHTVHNISGESPESRLAWEDGYEGEVRTAPKSQTPVLYFVGCVSSLYPSAAPIPQTFSEILSSTGVDFSVLGTEEWCCGFPLWIGGMRDEMEAIARRNVDAIVATGARTVVFTCPSCLRVFREVYPGLLGGPLPFDLQHSTEVIQRLMSKGALNAGRMDRTVTYHDSCELGRLGLVYDAPREALSRIPGVTIVEMENNREHSLCCGGGGNVEMTFPRLAAEMSAARLQEATAVGAQVLVTSCPQCKRMLASAAKKQGIRMKVQDLAEFICDAGIRRGEE